MKAIKNYKELKQLLETENSNWQEIIYDQTGTIVLFSNNDATLISNCGYIDLDADAEYRSVSGENRTEYCVIGSIIELVDYILQMESYQKYLVDVSLGKFKKSELFWAVYSQVITAEENMRRNDGSTEQDWGLYRIGEYYYRTKDEEEITLEMALIAFDSCEIWLPKNDNLTLNDYLDLLVVELNSTTETIEEIPVYRVRRNKEIHAPKTFTELRSIIQPGGIFDWLCQSWNE